MCPAGLNLEHAVLTYLTYLNYKGLAKDHTGQLVSQPCCLDKSMFDTKNNVT